MWSDSSDSYIASLSSDERYEQQKKQEEINKELEKRNKELQRKAAFENYFATNSIRQESIFNFLGVNFKEYTHELIVFTFTPSEIVEKISKKIRFRIILKYNLTYWRLSTRSHLALDLKKMFYKWFTINHKGSVHDDNIVMCIEAMHHELYHWSIKEEKLRIHKFQRYLKGDDVILNSEDEELFLTAEQRRELHRKRNKILKRMIPPGYHEPTKKRKKRTMVIFSDTSDSSQNT